MLESCVVGGSDTASFELTLINEIRVTQLVER